MSPAPSSSRAYRERGVLAAANERTISVKGSARRRLRSDLAVWRIVVNGEARELAEAFATINAGVERVRAFLESRGFAADQVGLAAIATETLYQPDKDGRPTGEIRGYRLSRAFSVTTPDVDRVSRSAGDVTQLIEQGVLVVSQPPDYYYTKLGDVKVAIMGEASQDARARAGENAHNAGCALAEVRRAQMGVLQITRPNATDVSDYGVHDTSTIDKDIQAVVTVTFGIQRRS